MTCTCGHADVQHSSDGVCICCACPGWTDSTALVPTLINGHWVLLLPPHRAYRLEWSTEEGWERARLDAMAEVIDERDIVYDIGAEEGDFGALFASWGADVVLVEPNPAVWPNIRTIFEGNDLRHKVVATWVGFAADFLRDGDDDWPYPYSCGDGWPDCAYGPVISDHGFLVLSERPDCPSTTIDVLSGSILRPPTVITIDVEGAELTVLRGARRVLERHRPRVFVSVHQDLDWIDLRYPGDDEKALYEYMISLGYEGTHLATDHEAHWCFTHTEGR